MTCEQRESTIIAYVSGELNESDAAACRGHIETCAHCRATYESYACVVDSITRESAPAPTSTESEALSRDGTSDRPGAHRARNRGHHIRHLVPAHCRRCQPQTIERDDFQKMIGLE